MNYIEIAEQYISEGFNPLPLHENKVPNLKIGHTFLYEPINFIKKRFSDPAMIGIACGKVSGGLYCIDFDKHKGENLDPIFNEFYENELIQNLIQEGKLSIYHTPSGGVHCYFRCLGIEKKNQEFALWEDGETMIELRGDGGYAACHPSPGYSHLIGTEIIKLEYIESEYVEYIFDYLRTFSQMPLDFKEKDGNHRKWPTEWDNSTLNGQYNNENGDEAIKLLEEAGWVISKTKRRDGVLYLVRPGKDEKDGHAATWGKFRNCFHVFSSSAHPFESGKSYNPFTIYTILKFGGDYKKALESLRNTKVDEQVNESPPPSSIKFPVEVFPEFIQELIADLNKSLNFHPDFLSAAVMFSVATVCGNKYKLQVKKGWDATPIFWLACVGFPGTIKTHPIKMITKPLISLDRESKRSWDIAMGDWLKENQPKKKGRKNPYSGSDNGTGDEHATKTPKPIFRQLIVSDYTIEALHHVHAINDRGLGLYKDELKGFINDMNKYRQGSDVEFWLESFNNGSFIVNRATKDPLMINDICVNIIGTIQHEVLSEIIAKFSGSGFIDRFLFTSPETSVFNINSNESDPRHFEKWESFLRKLNATNVYTGIPSVEHVKMTDEAFKAYQQIDSEYVQIQTNELETNEIKNYISKMKTYVPRFALIISLIENLYKDEYVLVDVRHMEAARKVASYFIATARITFSQNDTRTEIYRIVQTMKGLSRKDQIKKLFDQQFTLAQIGEFFNISRQRVSVILKK